MTPKEIIDTCRERGLTDLSSVLRYLAHAVVEAQTEGGMRVLDASDFRVWLRELAKAADRGERP